MTTAVVAPHAEYFSFCQARFDVAHGTYLGATNLGLALVLADGRSLRNDFQSDGPVLGPPLDGGTRDVVLPGAELVQAAVSPDGSQVVTLEGGEPAAIAVRSMPSLAAEQRVAADALLVAFTRDRRAIALATSGSETGVFEVTGGRLVSLGPRFEGVADMAVSARGDRAALTRTDGTREIVTLPGGDRVASLPPVDPQQLDASALALDPTGEVVAYAEPDGLFIAEVADGKAVVVHRDPALPRSSKTRLDLVFAPDSTTLFARSYGWVVAFRHNEFVPPRPAPAYAIDLPRGFRDASIRDDGEYSFSDFARDERVAPVGLIRAVRSADETIDVVAAALDPGEFPDSARASIEDWARLVMDRYDGDGAAIASVKTWSDALGRNLEYVRYQRDGCDPSDQYVRMSERDGNLYRIVVEVPPGLAPKRVAPHLHAFFDVPFGEPKDRRTVATAPQWDGSPC